MHAETRSNHVRLPLIGAARSGAVSFPRFSGHLR
jgi:hypothetical protein